MRFERKYKVDDLSLDVVHQVVRMHPSSFRQIYPDRQINNIYFDTPSFTTYKDNVKGIADRKKYRVRWYAYDPFLIKQPRFEIKIKSNQLGKKEVHPLEAFQLDNYLSLNRIVSHLSGAFIPLQASLMNAYHRSYYGTGNGKFRITIDHQLRYHSLLNGARFTNYQVADRGVVVELKYDAEYEEEANFIQQYLPFRQTKSSKYVTGITLTI